jgi:hypothetical protein
MKLSKSYLDAIKLIKSKGFSHIKVELEAELNRGDNDRSDCPDCDEGFVHCENCDNSGYVTATDQSGNDYEVECLPCNGEGTQECGGCGGRGVQESSWDTNDCQRWITERLAPEINKAFTYVDFYDDGSVDSEITFTLPIDKAHYTIDIIKAFRDLAETITGDNGNGIDISGSGMHIAILPSGSYPSSKRLNARYIENFKREVTKLLPALFFSASHCEITRDLDYRHPRITDDEKYSAIYTLGDRCIEYRLFDTCYDQPEAFFDKVEVIAGTLKFYSRQKLKVGFKEFSLPDVRHVNDWFTNLETYEALRETIKHVSPAKKGLERLKRERNVTVTKKSLVAEMRDKMREYRADYKGYRADWGDRQHKEIQRFIDEQIQRMNLGDVPYLEIPKEWLSPLDFDKVRQFLLEKNWGLEPKPLPFHTWYNECVRSRPYGRTVEVDY